MDPWGKSLSAEGKDKFILRVHNVGGRPQVDPVVVFFVERSIVLLHPQQRNNNAVQQAFEVQKSNTTFLPWQLCGSES